MKTKTKGLAAVLGFVQSISQFVIYLRAIIAAIEAVRDTLKKANDDESEE